MNKYTIKKLFEKSFPFPVWKIEVDSIRQNIAVESRDPNSTLPTYTIYSFEGHTLLDNYLINEKEWTIASIQGDYLILKKYGTSSPVQSGIRIIHFPTQTIIADLAEYIFQCAKKKYRDSHTSCNPHGTVILHNDFEWEGKNNNG